MISKDEILRSFPKEDIEEVLKVYQTMNLAYSKGITTFTNFFVSLIYGIILLHSIWSVSLAD